MPEDSRQTGKARPAVRAFNVATAGFLLGCVALVLCLPGNFQAMKQIRTQAEAVQFFERISAGLGDVQASLLVLALVAFSSGILLLASYRKQEYLSSCALDTAQNDTLTGELELAPPPPTSIAFAATQGGFDARAQAELDITLTENQRLRAHLTEMSQHVEELTSEHTDYLGRLCCELLEPVSRIANSCAQLQDSELDSGQIESVASIRLSTRDLFDRIDVLNDCSLLQSNRLDLEKTPFDLVAVIEEQCYLAEARDLLVTFQSADEIPSRVVGDKKRVCLIVQALLDNASEHSAQSKIEVSLSCIEKREGVTGFCVDVQDSGEGIPPERQLLLWKAFAAEEVTATGVLGPALSVANALVKRMHGRISIKSRLGEGTLFSAEFELDDVAMTGHAVPLASRHGRLQVLDDSAIEAIRLRQAPGQPDVVSRAISAWLTSSESALADARQACEDEDTARLLSSLIALSSGSRFVGAQVVAAACRRAERDVGALSEGSQSTAELAGIGSRLNEIEQAYNEVKPALQRLASSAA